MRPEETEKILQIINYSDNRDMNLFIPGIVNTTNYSKTGVNYPIPGDLLYNPENGEIRVATSNIGWDYVGVVTETERQQILDIIQPPDLRPPKMDNEKNAQDKINYFLSKI